MLYSRLPMPRIRWNEEDASHAASFLPLTGVVIGALSYFLIILGVRYDLPRVFLVITLTLIPFIVTGGFHIEGFLDVCDARHSFSSPEHKKEILKDPHLGAFAVIDLAVFLLIWIASLYLIVYKSLLTQDLSYLRLYSVVFFFVRAFCAVTCVMLDKMSGSRMLSFETKNTGRGDIVFIFLQIIGAAVFMINEDVFAAAASLLLMILFCLWYKRMTSKEFGGINGDTSGYFVAAGEELMVVALAALSWFNL